MKSPVLMSVKHLQCAYVEGTTVLSLNELNIPSGMLVFVIGRSGVGKSTLIETLGLMNKTILPRSETSIVLKTHQSEGYELKNSWDWTNEKISRFREQHFSFIFQNTNLMPNFSSGENMAISLLIKGEKFSDAKARVLSVMNRLSLHEEIFNKRITDISGGQRQRLAFVRAITANFSVLFGDEPTGNLDNNTSDELITLLKEQIQGEDKSAILVSHDLRLALKFADIIVPIVPVRDNEGEVVAGSVFSDNIIKKTSSGWEDAKGAKQANPYAYCEAFLD